MYLLDVDHVEGLDQTGDPHLRVDPAHQAQRWLGDQHGVGGGPGHPEVVAVGHISVEASRQLAVLLPDPVLQPPEGDQARLGLGPRPHDLLTMRRRGLT